jgi:hypothetical protein
VRCSWPRRSDCAGIGDQSDPQIENRDLPLFGIDTRQESNQTVVALSMVVKLRKCLVVPACLAMYCLAMAQISSGDREVHAHDLPSTIARSAEPSDVLAAALEMVLKDKEVCCGKDSALEDDVQRADARSLQNIAHRLQGRHLLSDGRPIMVTTEYLRGEQVSAGHMILMLGENLVPLIQWNSHLYVIDGMTYVESADSDGNISYLIHKFSMQDPRYSDSRRRVTFDRVTQDATKIQGILFVQAALQ